MKKLWVLIAVPFLLVALPGQSFAQPRRAQSSTSEEGYWKLASVDIQKEKDTAEEKSTLQSGGGTSLWTYSTSEGDGTFGTSYSWTRPADQYRAGQSVDLALSIEIDDYAWIDSFGEGPESVSDWITAGFYGGKALRDSNGIAEARVISVNGDIINRSESRNVSGKFPSGRKGEKLKLFVDCASAGAVFYIYEWTERPAGEEAAEKPVVREGSYWELTSVDIQKCPDNANSQYTLNRGSGTYRSIDPDEVFEFSFTFTEPGKLVYANQEVNISLNIEIDRYRWKGQFNHVGGYVGAGFMPGQPFTKSGDPKIWFAGVSGQNGRIIKGSDSVVLSGKFPPGIKNGTITFYIKTDHCATVLYHYKCTYADFN